MKDLNKLYKESLEEVCNAGIEPGNIVCVRVNNRAKHVWGYCKKKNGQYTIEISARILQDNIADIAIKQTIIHEILHTIKNGMEHKGAWEEAAKIINAKYPIYHVSRCTSADTFGIIDCPENHRYNVICQDCGHIYTYDRWCKVVENPSGYRCGYCNGMLKVKCNVENMSIYTAANKTK